MLIIALIMVTSIQVPLSQFSQYELSRRSGHGRSDAKAELRRQSARADILSLQSTISALLLVFVVVTAVAALGWGWGIVVGVIVSFSYGRVASVSFISSSSTRLYSLVESKIIDALDAVPWLMPTLRWSRQATNAPARLGSREELQHLVDQSTDILSDAEKKLVVHGLAFADKEVRSIMTPKSMIDTIKKDEVLGPLVLSELHSLGHSRLPVIDQDIDHVVGVLQVKDLLTLDDKQTTTAQQAMDKHVYYIHEHDSLEHALAAFLKTRRHLFIVVNEFRETVGLLTIEDVIEALLGRKIVDEDDIHDDVRAVAANNPKRNNRPRGGHDV